MIASTLACPSSLERHCSRKQRMFPLGQTVIKTPESGSVCVCHKGIVSGDTANDGVKPLFKVHHRNGWGGSCAKKTKHYFASPLTHSLQTSYTIKSRTLNGGLKILDGTNSVGESSLPNQHTCGSLTCGSQRLEHTL